jgi:hypothetical protein
VGEPIVINAWSPAWAQKFRDKAKAIRNELGPLAMRMVVFASVQELNETLCETNDDSFLEALRLAVTKKWEGYGLIELAREGKLMGERRPYPLDIGEVLPWFNEIEAGCERHLEKMRR